MFIKEYISNVIPTLDEKKKFLFALTLMDELKVSSLPVVKRNKYKGLLPEDVIYEFDLFDQSIYEYKQLLKPVSLKEDQTILDALNIFVQERIDLLPVVDETDNYVGVITKTDILKALSNLIASEEQGRILILRMNYNDLHVSQISKIIEDEGANIINLFMQPIPSSTEINVFIKVNKIDLTRIERSLQRYDYNVTTLSKNEEQDEDISQKYDLFMKYLNL